MIYLLRKPLIRRDKGDTLSLLVQFLLKLRVPCAPPPASLLISTIFELAATGPTLPFPHLFLVPPKSPPFPPWRLQLFSGFLRFLASFSPSPTCVCVCVCVCFLPIHSGHQVRWTYQPGSHRRKVTQDFSSTFFLRCVPQFFPREGFSHSFRSSTVKSNYVY